MRRRTPAARRRAPLLVAVLLVALNLRGAIAAVSPVLPQVRDDLSLSATSAGLLTSLPVLCFAVVAPVGAWLGHRLGLERAILLGLLGIAAGTVLRVVDGTPVLLLGTVLLGAAMTVGNVLVPVVVKRDFAGRAGTVTGLYTAALCAGAAATAALTAPVAGVAGWRAALAVWAGLALVAAVVWQLASAGRHATAGNAVPGSAPTVGVWQHPVSWAVALLLGSQSITYYAVTAWLPTLLVDDAGLDLAAAGLGMSVFQILGVAGTFVIPALASRRPQQGWLGVAVALGWAVMVAGLLVWPSAWLVWTVVGGIAQGAGISLAFTVLILRAADAATARSLSGMTQLVGYSIGALGPLAVGALYEATGGWTAPLTLLLAVCVAMGAAGLRAGRDVTVGGPASIYR